MNATLNLDSLQNQHPSYLVDKFLDASKSISINQSYRNNPVLWFLGQVLHWITSKHLKNNKKTLQIILQVDWSKAITDADSYLKIRQLFDNFEPSLIQLNIDNLEEFLPKLPQVYTTIFNKMSEYQGLRLEARQKIEAALKELDAMPIELPSNFNHITEEQLWKIRNTKLPYRI
jgi:hypothetical protein